MRRVLIVEDKASMADMLKETLTAEGFEAEASLDGISGIERMRELNPDLVLTDLMLPGKDGMEVLKASMELNPLRPVIMMTAHGSIETAVQAMRHGAFDFITKPFNTDHLLHKIRMGLENRRLVTENLLLREELSLSMPDIIGTSRAILDTAETIRKAAPRKTTILLLGESGTGKELFARAIHNLSGRKDYPFVAINCAAIPKDLLESELFGHEKGAFTGAESRKLGKLELADRGTVFLDEIGEMDKALQAKLLRAIQEGEIDRVGSTKPVKIDVRFVAASNKNLERAVEDGSFREDLFYRINVFPVRVPPLRERSEDIPMLVEHFITKHSGSIKARVKGIAPDAMRMLASMPWKGNIRELENTIERAIILCDTETITPEHIGHKPSGPSDEHFTGPLEEVSRAALRTAESRRIREALRETGGNKTKAAALLEVSYKTLLTKIKEYGLE